MTFDNRVRIRTLFDGQEDEFGERFHRGWVFFNTPKINNLFVSFFCFILVFMNYLNEDNVMKTLEVKVLTIVCLCAMCAWALNTTTIDNKTFYQIATCQDMVAFADLVNTQTSSGYGGYGSYGGYGAPEYGNKSANAIVTAAIDMTCTNEFPMIGAADDNRRYVGTFDGQNFPIRGLKLTANTQNVGLFAAIGEGAYIKNMVVQDVEITGTLGNQTDYPSIGGMVGWMHNGTIEGCYVSGTVKGTAEKEAIGGVVGNAWGGTIKDCLSEVTVIGEKNLDYVGGIVGYAKGEGNDNTQAAGVTISSCVFNGDVVANGNGVVIGGIVGTCDKEQFIVNSFYSGDAANYGVGSGANNSIATVETHFTRTGGTNEPVLNSEETVCKLNGGTWNNNVCSGATSDVWSSGDGISNGAGTFDNNGNAYYTISFSANGGAFAEGATTWKKLSRGTQISSDGISQPTRTNYAFVGWSKNQNASTADANLGNVEKAATIYAVWNYSVAFNSNGGSDVATKYVATSGNATVTAPANPTKSGYDFEGWYKESGLNNKWNFATDKVTSSITLYAKWTPKKYTFTIENASIASPSIDGKYDYGSQVTLNATVPEHYHFVKWEDGNTDNPRTVTVGETNTYKAVVAIDQFKVTFYDENGTTVLKSETLYDYGTPAANIAKPSNPTKSATAEFSYEFSGWSPALAAVTENVNYVAAYASSRVKYTLTWNFDGGAAAGTEGVGYTKAGLVENAATITYPTVSKDKYDFDGWSPAGVTAMPTHNQTFTALWKVKKVEIAVIYGADATKDSIHIMVNATDDESSVVNQIEAALEAAGVTPTKESSATTDYTYNGEWVQNTSGEYVAQFDESAREYTVTLNVPDGASVSPAMTKYAAGTAATLPSANLDGWTFVGWVDGSGNSVTQIAADATGDKAYTAVFTKDITVVYGEGAGDKLQVEIELDDNEAEIIAKIEAALEAAGVTPAKASDADSTYAFSGWDVDGNTYTAEFKGTLITETVVVKYGEGAGDQVEVIVPKAADTDARIAIVNDSLTKKGITPSKSADADSTYAFSGWDVDGNTYTAEFKGTLITETVIVKYGKNASDTILVIVPETADSVARVATVNEAFENHDPAIEKPQKTDGSADSTYAFTGFVPDENGVYTPAFTAEEKTVTMVLAYGEGVDERINVVVPVTYDSEKRLNAIDSTLAAQNPPIEIKKINGSEDSTYTYVGWRTRIDKDSNVVLDENGNPVFEPIFEAEVKTTELVVVYGADATKDVVKIQVPVTLRDSAARVQLVTDSLAAWNITPTKPADEDSTYEFMGKWNIDGDVISAEFKSTPKYIEVVVGGDTVKVVVPEDDSGAGSDPSGKISVDVVLVVDGDTVKATVNDGDILDEAAKDAMNGDIPTKAETADSTFEFAGWTPVVDSTGKTVVDENGNVVYEPSFEGEVKKETIAVVTDSGDTVEVEIHVPDTDEKIQQKIVDEFGKDGIVLPTKDETADSTFEFAGWTPVVDSTGKAVVDENGNAVYEPSFDSEVKKAVIAVVADDGDTVEVEIHVPDTDEKVQQKIVDELAAANVPLPTKPQTDEFMYKFEKFVRNDSTGVYEPVFVKVARVYDIDFRLPKTGKLLTVFNGYVYGEFTKLPGAYIENDSTWEFMGWYTEDDGFGEKVKAMKPTDSGDKILYPLFQKEITYEVDGTKGQIIVAYSETAEYSIFRALDGVKPADYEKEGLTFAVESWIEGDDGVFRPNFTQGISRVAAAPHFSVFADGRTLSIDGAKVGATIAVFDMRGSLVAKSFVTNATQRIELAKPGSYIVRVNNQTMRVNVR